MRRLKMTVATSEAKGMRIPSDVNPEGVDEWGVFMWDRNVKDGFQIEVQKTSAEFDPDLYHADLCVFDLRNGNKEILRETVIITPLMFVTMENGAPPESWLNSIRKVIRAARS